LIITEAKHALFFKRTRSGFVYQELRDFVKMTLTRVSSHWLWLESSHSVKNVSRVESPFYSTCRVIESWLESSPNHQKSWLESRYHCVFEKSRAWTGHSSSTPVNTDTKCWFRTRVKCRSPQRSL